MALGYPRAGTPLTDASGQPTRPFGRLLRNIVAVVNGSGFMLTGTHTSRLALDVAQLTNGTSFFETDRGVFYTLVAGAWAFASGTMHGQFAQAPLDLGASDRGFQFAVEDYNHLVKWCGAAWYFAPGDPGPGLIADFAIAPPGVGWQLCDGTVTTYLTVGAALGHANFTTPGLVATPAFRKSGAAYTGVINAAGNTAVDTGGGTIVAAGVGTTVAAHTHVHVNGDPANLVMLPYFRR